MTIRYSKLTLDQKAAIRKYARDHSHLTTNPLHLAACAAAAVLTTDRQHANTDTAADAFAAALAVLCFDRVVLLTVVEPT